MQEEEIKLLLKDFKQTTSNSSKKMVSIKYDEVPIEPNLMGYLFKNILGFNVQYHVFEKINYIIFFTYKNYEGCISHRKLCYELEIENEVKDEVLEILSKAKILLEEHFLQISKDSLKNNDYSLDNSIGDYKQRLLFYANQIKKNNQVIKNMQSGKRKSRKIIKTVHYEQITDLSYKYKCALMYNLESYIDSFYSFLEHILTLMSAFTNYRQKYDTFLDVIKAGWTSKWTLVFGKDEVSDALLAKLSTLKDLFRNRLSHGMFSKELKVFVKIENFGYYPLFVGEKLKGFSANEQITLDFNKFIQIQNLFDEVLNLFKQKYKCEMIIIESGQPIYLNMEHYKKALLSPQNAEKYVDYMTYMYDNQINMDW